MLPLKLTLRDVHHEVCLCQSTQMTIWLISSLVAKLRANGKWMSRQPSYVRHTGSFIGVIVDNAQPPCLQVDPGAPDNYGHYDGIRKGLRDAAVAIWQSTHLDPQLIVVIEPVSVPRSSFRHALD